MVLKEAILSGRGNCIRLILAEREGNHVVERSCFNLHGMASHRGIP